MMTKPIEVFYWPTTNSWKVTIMLEEINHLYTIKYVNLSKGEQYLPDFLKISPNGRIPATIDPDGPHGKPVSIFESGAILQYLARKSGLLYPSEERARIEVEEWLFWQVSNLGPMSGQVFHFKFRAPEKNEYSINRYVGEVCRLYGVMDNHLADREFLAGKYSIADIATVVWVTLHKDLDQKIEDFKNPKRWLETIKGRPAVDKGLSIGKEKLSH